jgi:hypothetical protein
MEECRWENVGEECKWIFWRVRYEGVGLDTKCLMIFREIDSCSELFGVVWSFSESSGDDRRETWKDGRFTNTTASNFVVDGYSQALTHTNTQSNAKKNVDDSLN